MTEIVDAAPDFADSVVLITGAAGGIGAATARKFALRGARVALVDTDADALDRLAGGLQSYGIAAGSIATFAADVSDEDDVAGYVAATMERFGGLDVLFNNAGIEGAVASVDVYDTDRFDQVMRVNVRGVFLNCKHVVAAMRQLTGRGSIVNTGSAVSLVGAPDLGPYTASKHAVLGLTRSLALELAETGIRVNAVCPGPIDTRMQHAIEDGMVLDRDAAREAVMGLIPMRRYGTPEEIANVVLFLASDDSSFMTGAAVAVDGAFTTG